MSARGCVCVCVRRDGCKLGVHVSSTTEGREE